MRIDRSTRHAVVALALTLAAAPVHADDAATTASEVGPAFERARTLAGEERTAALRALEPDVERWIKHASGAEERLQARYLEGALRAGLADWTAAAEAFGRAADADAKSPFADDAAFAAIRSLEAGNRQVLGHGYDRAVAETFVDAQLDTVRFMLDAEHPPVGP